MHASSSKYAAATPTAAADRAKSAQQHLPPAALPNARTAAQALLLANASMRAATQRPPQRKHALAMPTAPCAPGATQHPPGATEPQTAVQEASAQPNGALAVPVVATERTCALPLTMSFMAWPMRQHKQYEYHSPTPKRASEQQETGKENRSCPCFGSMTHPGGCVLKQALVRVQSTHQEAAFG